MKAAQCFLVWPGSMSIRAEHALPQEEQIPLEDVPELPDDAQRGSSQPAGPTEKTPKGSKKSKKKHKKSSKPSPEPQSSPATKPGRGGSEDIDQILKELGLEQVRAARFASPAWCTICLVD